MAVNLLAASSRALNLALDLDLLKNVSGGTLMAWIRPTALPSATLGIVGVSIGPPPGTSNNPRLRMSLTSTFRIQITARALDGDVTSTFTSNVLTPSLGEWIHAACVVNYVSQNVLIYVNGTLFGSSTLGTTAGNTSNTNAMNAAIGSNLTANGSFFNGDVEDVRVYERILGNTEIMTIFTSLGKDGIWSGCRLRYPLTELSPGSTVVLAPSLGTLNRGASPVNAPSYSIGITTTRRRVVSPG